MKNIAVMVPCLHGGGAERMAANMALELQKKYNVYMIVFSSENITYEYGGTLVDIGIPPKKDSSFFRRLCVTLKRARRVRSIKKKYGIACTISHMEGANLVNIFSGRGDKILSVFHSMPSQNLRKSRLNILMQRFIGKFSDKYIFVSKLGAHDIVHSFGVNEKNVMPIYNFCHAAKQPADGNAAMDNQAVADFYAKHSSIFLNIGRLSPSKGQRHLLKAFSKVHVRHPEAGLVILGEGEERERLEQLAAELHLEQNVCMPGFLHNLFPYIRQADVFVLSSHYEGLPMVLIEAASCGCPIVSTDMPSGAREVLAPDTDILYAATEKEYAAYGILVPVCKGEADAQGLTAEENILADAMAELLENRELREKYIESSKKCANNFSAETIMKQWEALIEGTQE